MIVIVDYGVGNLGSIRNIFKKIGYRAEPSSDPAVLKDAEKLILPGVGAFDAGMSKLRERGLVDLLSELVLEKKIPVLGHCLGMQLMARKSDEGRETGLGWIEADCIRFNFDAHQNQLKIPHMGWNQLDIKRPHPVISGLGPETRFYFVHTYHVVCANDADIVAYTDYGYKFASIIQKGNIFGAQFHPEKSHRFGMQFLKNFAEISL